MFKLVLKLIWIEMNPKQPKNDHKYLWTFHSKGKLFQYGITPNNVKRVIRHPDRKQEGIAEETIAVMKRKDTKSAKKELWVMYQKIGAKKRIISAWIYPGESPKGKEIFVPDDVWVEIEKFSIREKKFSDKKQQERGKNDRDN